MDSVSSSTSAGQVHDCLDYRLRQKFAVPTSKTATCLALPIPFSRQLILARELEKHCILYKLYIAAMCAGGNQDLRPGNKYFDAVSHMMDLSMKVYEEKGEVFPIHFTCLGWQLAAVKFSENPDILSTILVVDPFDAWWKLVCVAYCWSTS